ncbi:hemerythrin domain-containing protein [Arthrobacter sp. NPDC089319]|uniref:hemerythrin domain-containing protein n=1 Tax=Arthrobacter sp. NPDC089319 TaxID=3155915 RepID=UPI00342E41A2
MVIETNVEAENAAMAAMVGHHTELVARVQATTAELTRAIDIGDEDTAYNAHGILLEWGEREMLPHAAAEEAQLYGPAGARVEARLLVDALTADHQELAALLDELRGAAGIEAATVASSLSRVFALHIEKENRVLLPFIARTPDLSLSAAVEGLVELVGDTHVHAPDESRHAHG